ncbi:SGNH/GDSL hydrolase family protein [Isoptericola aurantiacus]|uniref:SGNH/GDSL hydrolase family protein n=1 Tax=Isoptericola aurantiacus TaxID=3377839 RepID=UPI00383A5A61
MSSGPAVVALGDSITAGVVDAVGSDAAHGPGWAAHLALLAGCGSFENVASNGARTRTVVAEQLDRALDARPDVATLVIGGNDVLRSDFSPAEVARHLGTCVGALRDRGAAVVLATLPSIGLFDLCPGRIRRIMRARIDAVNAVVRTTAARYGSASGRQPVLFDVAEAIRPAGLGAWYVDRVHPSPAGHRHMAVTASGALQVALPELAARGLRATDPDGSLRAALSRLPAPPPPPSAWQRAAWLTVAGVPWGLRRGRDFLPGLLRAVVDDLRGAGPGQLDLDLGLDLAALSGPGAGHDGVASEAYARTS